MSDTPPIDEQPVSQPEEMTTIRVTFPASALDDALVAFGAADETEIAAGFAQAIAARVNAYRTAVAQAKVAKELEAESAKLFGVDPEALRPQGPGGPGGRGPRG